MVIFKVDFFPDFSIPHFSREISRSPISRFSISRREMCISILDLSFVEKLFDYHKGEARFLIKEHLFGYVLILCKQFEHFAMSLADFVSLPKMDQTKLLHQNTPMYVQLILAMYFNGKTGFEQLSALPGIEPQMNEVYLRVALDRMNQQLGLFHPSSFQQYQNLLESDDFQVSK